ncbi:hypothetical protein GCM10007386_50090 [Pseudoduganella dura]|nr:hypothetical protein GCM10007386_50090 [Pseudoduganella dura]
MGAAAQTTARVYPVQGVFWDEREPAIEQRFLRAQDIAGLSQQVRTALDNAFAGRTGELTQKTAGGTFAVSFHLTRMAQYATRKPDGNLEIRTPVTGSIYFTNVQTGEILFTQSDTNVALGLVAARDSAQVPAEVDKLYASALTALIAQLCSKAGQQFQPHAVEAKIAALQNGLMVLDGGYQQGIQSGDSLEDEQSNLIRIVYAGAGYAVAERVLVDSIKPGMVFRKYVVGKIDGRRRPRVAVVVDQAAAGFSREYLNRMFSEALGQQAPFTLVQVNPNFTNLLKTVAQHATLSTSSTAQRETPDLLIRLRVPDPIHYEAKTNLAFRTVRGFEANAYAELIDTTGRVLMATSGHDAQKIEVDNGFDMDPLARREIAVKNALLAVARQLGTVAEAQPDAAPVARVDANGIFVATPAKVYPQQAPGYLLRPTTLAIGGKPVKLLFPMAEATTAQREGAETRIAPSLPFGEQRIPVVAGDVFETLQLGAVPKSAAAFSLCPDSETLGSVQTPQLENVASLALAQAMPGNFYAPEVRELADTMINPGTSFRDRIRWSVPPVTACIQLVQRVDATGEQCEEHCQQNLTARYTMRVRENAQVTARVGLESKFRSSGYEKSTTLQAVNSLVRSDLIDEARKLLSAVAAKLVFPSTK